MLKSSPQSIEFHIAASKDLTSVNQTLYVKKDEPTTSRDLNYSDPIDCENGQDIDSLRKLDNAHKINVIPFTDKNISVKN